MSALPKKESKSPGLGARTTSDVEEAGSNAVMAVALTLYHLEQYEEAMWNFSRLLDINSSDASIWNYRGFCYSYQNKHEEAVSDFSRAIELEENTAKYWFDRGICYAQQERFQEALSDFTTAIAGGKSSLTPCESRSDFWSNRGRCLMKLKRYTEAISDLSKGIEVDATSCWVWSNRADCFFEMEKFDLASRDYETAMRLRRSEPLFVYKFGLCMKGLGKHDSYHFSDAIRIGIKLPDCWFQRGECFMKKNQFRTALNDYKKATEMDPSNSMYWLKYADCLKELRRYPQALKAYNEAVKLNNETNFQYIYSRSQCYLISKQHKEAVEDLTKVIEMSIESDKQKYHFERGMCYKEMERYEEAVEDLTKAIEVKVDPEYHFNRGVCYNEAKKYEEAVEDFTKAIDLNDKISKYWYNRSVTYEKLEKYEEAVSDLTKGIELDGVSKKEDGDAKEDGGSKEEKCISDWSRRGRCLIKLQRYEEALSDLTKGIEHEQNNSITFSSRGDCYFELEKYEEAEKDYKKAIKLGMEEPSVHYKLGLCVVQASGPALARRHFFRAIELGLNVADCHARLGDIYVEEGLVEKASEQYKAARELDPSNLDYWTKSADSLIKCEHYEEALMAVSEAIRLDGTSPKLYFNRSFIYECLTRHVHVNEDQKPTTTSCDVGEETEKIKESGRKHKKTRRRQNEQERESEREKDGQLTFEYSFTVEELDEKFLVDITRAIELKDNDPTYFHKRGMYYIKKERYEEAIEDLTVAIDLSPSNSGYRTERASCFSLVGKMEESISDCDVVIADTSGSKPKRNKMLCSIRRASCLLQLERYEEALEGFIHTKKAFVLRRDKDYITCFSGSGMCCLKLGKFEDAVQYFTVAIKLNGHIADLYYNRGVSYKEMKEYEKAVKDMMKAVELEPEEKKYDVCRLECLKALEEEKEKSDMKDIDGREQDRDESSRPSIPPSEIESEADRKVEEEKSEEVKEKEDISKEEGLFQTASLFSTTSNAFESSTPFTSQSVSSFGALSSSPFANSSPFSSSSPFVSDPSTTIPVSEVRESGNEDEERESTEDTKEVVSNTFEFSAPFMQPPPSSGAFSSSPFFTSSPSAARSTSVLSFSEVSESGSEYEEGESEYEEDEIEEERSEVVPDVFESSAPFVQPVSFGAFSPSPFSSSSPFVPDSSSTTKVSERPTPPLFSNQGTFGGGFDISGSTFSPSLSSSFASLQVSPSAFSTNDGGLGGGLDASKNPTFTSSSFSSPSFPPLEEATSLTVSGETRVSDLKESGKEGTASVFTGSFEAPSSFPSSMSPFQPPPTPASRYSKLLPRVDPVEEWERTILDDNSLSLREACLKISSRQTSCERMRAWLEIDIEDVETENVNTCGKEPLDVLHALSSMLSQGYDVTPIECKMLSMIDGVGEACLRIGGQQTNMDRARAWLRAGANSKADGASKCGRLEAALMYFYENHLRYRRCEVSYLINQVNEDILDQLYHPMTAIKPMEHMFRQSFIPITLLCGSLKKNKQTSLYRSFFSSKMREVRLLPIIARYLYKGANWKGEREEIHFDPSACHTYGDMELYDSDSVAFHLFRSVSPRFPDWESHYPVTNIQTQSHFVRFLSPLLSHYHHVTTLNIYNDDNPTLLDLSLFSTFRTNNLVDIKISNCMVNSLSPLSQCTLYSLTSLKLENVSGLKTLGGLTNNITKGLYGLNLDGCRDLVDISALNDCDLTSLKYLYFSGAPSLSDISCLQGLNVPSLKSVMFKHTGISDISVLSTWKCSLRCLDLSHTPLVDISPLNLLTFCQEGACELNITGALISDFFPLWKLPVSTKTKIVVSRTQRDAIKAENNEELPSLLRTHVRD